MMNVNVVEHDLTHPAQPSLLHSVGSRETMHVGYTVSRRGWPHWVLLRYRGCIENDEPCNQSAISNEFDEGVDLTSCESSYDSGSFDDSHDSLEDWDEYTEEDDDEEEEEGEEEADEEEEDTEAETDGWETNTENEKEDDKETQGREVVDSDNDEGNASSDSESPSLGSSQENNSDRLRCALNLHGSDPHSKFRY